MWEVIWYIIIAIISAIPLNLAAKMIGGESSILKVIFINIIYAVLSFFLAPYLGNFAAIGLFILLLFIYKVMFDVGWIRALFIWVLQFVIIGLIILALIAGGIGLAFL